jgi:uncharacterized membrane protein YdjX (TVP38/TMEM64 family)
MILAILTFRFTPLNVFLTEETLSRFLKASSLGAPLIFVITYAVGVCLFVPGTLLTALGAAIFGPYWGFLYVWVGAMIGASTAFWIGRNLGRDFAASVIGDRLKKYDEAIERNGFATVFYLRMIYFPFTPMNFGMGLTKVRFSDYFWATALGIIMGTFIFTFFVGTLREVWGSGHWGLLYSGKALFSLMLFIFSLFIPKLMKRFKREERFLLLNRQERDDTKLERPIDVVLVLALADLKSKFFDMERGSVSYQKIRGSEEFERYKGLTGRLRSFDLTTLKSRGQRLAFWINLYNTAVIHGIIESGLRQSVKEIHGFFDRITYDIGGHRFSLNDMEHGILRGNRRHPYRLFKPFQRGDPRFEFAVVPMDPRIHFALVCGARSCPPIGFYEAEQIDFQLELAAASFINSPQVKIPSPERTVLLSMIFKWYKTDFGGNNQALMESLLTHLDEGEKKDFLRQNRDRIRLRYQSYDWNLNQA